MKLDKSSEINKINIIKKDAMDYIYYIITKYFEIAYTGTGPDWYWLENWINVEMWKYGQIEEKRFIGIYTYKFTCT